MPAQACLDSLEVGATNREITWMDGRGREGIGKQENKTEIEAGEERRMTRNPIYDYPEPYANPRSGVPSSPRKISLVGRLRLTQPVWLQLGINSATALHILQREPPGTFLVRRSNTWQCQVLSLRLPDNSSPAFVTTYRLRQERAVVFLEGSELTFPSLLHLIASYCSAPDILPLPLCLPRPIWEASSCQQLEAIAHLGLEFWNSSLNAKGFDKPAPSVLPSMEDADSLLEPMADPNVWDPTDPASGRSIRNRGLANLPSDGARHGDVGARRQHFKTNVKVQVSTEAASPLSPPAAPPPPIPVGKKIRKQSPGSDGRNHSSSHRPLPQGVTKLEAYCVPRSKEEEPGGQSGAAANPVLSSGPLRSVMEEEQRELHDPASTPGHFPWDFAAQGRGELGNGVRNRTLSSSAPS